MLEIREKERICQVERHCYIIMTKGIAYNRGIVSLCAKNAEKHQEKLQDGKE
ncbi:MAG TPA: hypothetical protein VGO09_08280 [Flavisolibacter sp.]|nr:hypothetical protein [Flavisolibacter sp.]